MKHANWLSSKVKWEKIVKNIRNRNKFDGVNFYDVNVIGWCGYCHEFQGECDDCPLSERDTENGKCCYGLFGEVGVLLVYGNYKAALPLAKKILDFIINDEPEKKA